MATTIRGSQIKDDTVKGVDIDEATLRPPITTVTATGTTDLGADTHHTVIVNVNSPNTANIRLPAASGNAGKIFIIKRAGNIPVIISTVSGNIDNAPTLSLLTIGECITVQSDDSNWWILNIPETVTYELYNQSYGEYGLSGWWERSSEAYCGPVVTNTEVDNVPSGHWVIAFDGTGDPVSLYNRSQKFYAPVKLFFKCQNGSGGSWLLPSGAASSAFESPNDFLYIQTSTDAQTWTTLPTDMYRSTNGGSTYSDIGTNGHIMGGHVVNNAWYDFMIDVNPGNSENYYPYFIRFYFDVANSADDAAITDVRIQVNPPSIASNLSSATGGAGWIQYAGSSGYLSATTRLTYNDQTDILTAQNVSVGGTGITGLSNQGTLCGKYYSGLRVNYNGADSMGLELGDGSPLFEITQESNKYRMQVIGDGYASRPIQIGRDDATHNVILSAANVTLDASGHLAIDGDLTVNGADIKGPIDSSLNIRSDENVNIHLDDDNDVANSAFNIYNGADNAVFTVDESGNANVAGTLTANSLSFTFNQSLTLTDDLTVGDFALITALRVGGTATDPGDGNLYVEGAAAIAGVLTAALDTDTEHFLGRTVIGHNHYSDMAGLSHYHLWDTDRAYALLQNGSGTTYLNCFTGQNLYFRCNNTTVMKMNETGLRIGSDADPTQALNVTGNIHASGNFSAVGDMHAEDVYADGDLVKISGNGYLVDSAGVVRISLGGGADTTLRGSGNATALTVPAGTNDVDISGDLDVSGALIVDGVSNLLSTVTMSGDVVVPTGKMVIGDATDIRSHLAGDVGVLNLHSNDVTADDAAQLTFSHYKTSLTSGANLGEIWWMGSEDDSTYNAVAYMIGEAAGTWTGSSRPSQLKFGTCPANSTVAAEAMIIDSSKNVTISGDLYVDGVHSGTNTDAKIDTSSGLLTYYSSTEKIKDNIQPHDKGLTVLNAIRPVSFNMKGTGAFDLGFIAEEVNEVDPSLVILGPDFSYSDGQPERDDEGKKVLLSEDQVPISWNTGGMVSVLVKAVQELSAKVEVLEAKVEELSNG